RVLTFARRSASKRSSVPSHVPWNGSSNAPQLLPRRLRWPVTLPGAPSPSINTDMTSEFVRFPMKVQRPFISLGKEAACARTLAETTITKSEVTHRESRAVKHLSIVALLKKHD